MNPFNCSERHIQSLSPHYLRLRRSLRGIEGGPTQSSSLSTLPHSHQRKRQKRKLLIKDRGKKIPRIQHNRKRKRRREEKDGGHALINERLISTKLITGSWMWGREGWKEGRGKRGKKREKRNVTWCLWVRRWEFCPCLFPITPPNLSHSPQRSDHKPSLWLSQKTFIGCQFAWRQQATTLFFSLLWDRTAAAPPLAMALQFFLF